MSQAEGASPSSAKSYPYATHLDIMFAPLENIDVDAVVSAVRDEWYNQTLCRVNDSVVRLGVLRGEYHWHKHDVDDEFFFVLDGVLLIDFEPTDEGAPGKTVALERHHGYAIPRGVVHRTRAAERTIILMMETANIVPTGD